MTSSCFEYTTTSSVCPVLVTRTLIFSMSIRLLRLDPRCLHDLGPLRDLHAQPLCELLRRIRHRLAAFRRELLAHFGLLRDRTHLGVQELDERPRRRLRREETLPRDHLVARNRRLG